MGGASILETDQQFKYLSSTLQIYNPGRNLCLDAFPRAPDLSFSRCHPNSSQQFVITTGNRIYNLGFSIQVCVSGIDYMYSVYNEGNAELILWSCTPSDSIEILDIILICPPGNMH